MENQNESSNNRSNTKRTRTLRRFSELERERIASGNPDSSGGNDSKSGEPSSGDRGDTGDSGESTEPNAMAGNPDSVTGNPDDGVRIKITESGASTGRRGRGRPRNIDRNRSDGDTSGRNPSSENSGQTTTSNFRGTQTLTFENLFEGEGKKKRGRKPNSANDIPGLSTGFQFLFSLPTFPFLLGDTHSHWNLTEIQAEELSKAFVKALGSSENKNFAKLLKMIEKYMPVIMLLSCVYIITSPRIKESLRILNDAKRAKRPVSVVADFPTQASPYARANEDASRAGSFEPYQETVRQ